MEVSYHKLNCAGALFLFRILVAPPENSTPLIALAFPRSAELFISASDGPRHGVRSPLPSRRISIVQIDPACRGKWVQGIAGRRFVMTVWRRSESPANPSPRIPCLTGKIQGILSYFGAYFPKNPQICLCLKSGKDFILKPEQGIIREKVPGDSGPSKIGLPCRQTMQNRGGQFTN